MTLERPMFPPRADSTDAFPLQPAGDLFDLAQLRFVRFLVRYGATLDEAGAIVAGEILRVTSGKHRRRNFTLSGRRV